jgi:uracil-xanthine permease
VPALDRIWKLHGDGRVVSAGDVVRPDERLSWPLTVGVGMQHVIAMFGATVLIPILMKFPPSTAVFFSGIGTLVYLAFVRNRVPSYLGSSAAFIAPVLAAQQQGGIPAALGGIVVTGAAFFLVGLVIDRTGSSVIQRIMPPLVTGTIVAVIGLNLAPIAKQQWDGGKLAAFVTLAAILLIGVGFRGFVGRISIFLGVIVGYAFEALRGRVEFRAVGEAAWLGLPELTTPTFELAAILLVLPAVLVLIAENTGHVKAVASMTERNLDDYLGRAYMGDGAATFVAGLGGGAGTTTYAENIGVMAATKVYSTAAYVVAALTAIGLGFIPKFAALIGSIPVGVLGGASTVLFGLIAVLGARIWIEAGVDFRDPVNLTVAAFAIIMGAGNYEVAFGDYSFGGIALGSFGAIIAYHLLRAIGGRREDIQREVRETPATGPAGGSPGGAAAPGGPVGGRGTSRRSA